LSSPGTSRVQAVIDRLDLDAELISTPQGVPTVETAAAALCVAADRIIKTLVFIGPAGELVVAIACGAAKVDRHKLAEAASLPKVRIASPEDVLSTTGYPAGGVAPIDLPEDAIVVVDAAVAGQAELYGGSGDDLHMLRIQSADIVRLNRAIIARILRDPAP